MGILNDLNRKVDEIQKNPDIVKIRNSLEKGVKSFKDELEKNKKDSDIVDAEYTKNEKNNEPKFCPKCGVKTEPQHKFCKNCGHQLIKSDVDEKNNADKDSDDFKKSFKIPIHDKNKDQKDLNQDLKDFDDELVDTNENRSITDEIMKFHDLKERGIISSKEFEEMKKKLLNL